MNNKELSHNWAHQTRDSGKGSSYYFEGPTIYSYGSHFPIARHYKGVILFTTSRYSVTTSKHISITHGACSHMTVYNCGHVMDNPCAKHVKYYAEHIKDLALNAARARNPDGHLQSLQRAVDEANSFCERFGFKTRFSMPDNLEELKAKARASAERERKQKAAKLAKFEAGCALTVQQWLAGDKVQIPSGLAKVYLRARAYQYEEGQEPEQVLETSKGAIVPLTDAEKTFRFVMAVRARGWHRNGDKHSIGNYQLDAVNEQGVIAGCHRVTWDEVERFAKSQGWTA